MRFSAISAAFGEPIPNSNSRYVRVLRDAVTNASEIFQASHNRINWGVRLQIDGANFRSVDAPAPEWELRISLT